MISFLVVISTILYVILVGLLFFGLIALPKNKTGRRKTEHTQFSIIIPFRNEEKYLFKLLKSISKMDYPKEAYEILVVDDQSTDDSLEEINRFIRYYPYCSIRVLQNIRKSNSPKKDAINTAIAVAKYNWIVSTDADCLAPRRWLRAYNAFIQSNDAKFIAGPVQYIEKPTFLSQFQQLDWMSLTAATMGGFGQKYPMLCSGANLCYTKESFYEVNGFVGNDSIASGDDVFLLAKMKLYFPNNIFFINDINAIVQTYSVPTWKELVEQRVRWASKTANIPNFTIRVTGLIVLAMNTALLLTLLRSIGNIPRLLFLGNLFLVKVILDSILVYTTAHLLERKINHLAWIGSSLLYPFFSVGVVLVSFYRKYDWKGRSFVK